MGIPAGEAAQLLSFLLPLSIWVSIDPVLEGICTPGKPPGSQEIRLSSALQIRGGTEDNLKIIFLTSQQKHML